MAEYIEREKLYDFLTEQLDQETGMYSKGRNDGINVARSALHNRQITPAADVVAVRTIGEVAKVVHGEWVQIEYDEMMDKITCSHCKEKWSIIDNCTETFNYCPNCGAKMDGGKHETD